jgi:hypothetical protein
MIAIRYVQPCSATQTEVLGRAEARCAAFAASVSSARPPNRTCTSQRIRLSTSRAVVSAVWLQGLGMRAPR